MPVSYSLRNSVGLKPASEHTVIELTGTDRPGLLSEVFSVLVDLKCNVVGVYGPITLPLWCMLLMRPQVLSCYAML